MALNVQRRCRFLFCRSLSCSVSSSTGPCGQNAPTTMWYQNSYTQRTEVGSLPSHLMNHPGETRAAAEAALHVVRPPLIIIRPCRFSSFFWRVIVSPIRRKMMSSPNCREYRNQYRNSSVVVAVPSPFSGVCTTDDELRNPLPILSCCSSNMHSLHVIVPSNSSRLLGSLWEPAPNAARGERNNGEIFFFLVQPSRAAVFFTYYSWTCLLARSKRCARGRCSTTCLWEGCSTLPGDWVGE